MINGLERAIIYMGVGGEFSVGSHHLRTGKCTKNEMPNHSRRVMGEE